MNKLVSKAVTGGGEWAANITNTIFFILIRFRLKELKRNKKGQNIVPGGRNLLRGGPKIFRALRAPSFVPNF